jgi:hypothetical protein
MDIDLTLERANPAWADVPDFRRSPQTETFLSSARPRLEPLTLEPALSLAVRPRMRPSGAAMVALDLSRLSLPQEG